MARPARARAASPVRALAAGRARARRRQEARPDRARRRQALARRQAPALHRQLHRCDRPPPQSRRLGVRPRRYAEVLPDEKATTAIGFLRRAVGFYRRYGIRVERLLTDNGSAYVSIAHAIACRQLKIRHLRTRPYRPQTNGKAERLSAPCSPAGPTGPSTGHAANAPPPLTAGSGTTTIADDTQPSATSPGQHNQPARVLQLERQQAQLDARLHEDRESRGHHDPVAPLQVIAESHWSARSARLHPSRPDVGRTKAAVGARALAARSPKDHEGTLRGHHRRYARALVVTGSWANRDFRDFRLSP